LVSERGFDSGWEDSEAVGAFVGEEPGGRNAKRAIETQNKTISTGEYFAIEVEGLILPNAYGSTRMTTSTMEMT
jgi:hypothetical protein